MLFRSLQNEELKASKAELDAGLEKFTDLYDFAPVGYFTLAIDGTVQQVNLTGTTLVGIGRSQLVGRRFGLLLRHEVAQTVSDPAEVEDEMRALLNSLR